MPIASSFRISHFTVRGGRLGAGDEGFCWETGGNRLGMSVTDDAQVRWQEDNAGHPPGFLSRAPGLEQGGRGGGLFRA
jgi:hypothetical protein